MSGLADHKTSPFQILSALSESRSTNQPKYAELGGRYVATFQPNELMEAREFVLSYSLDLTIQPFVLFALGVGEDVSGPDSSEICVSY
jgi:hypothetical protein